MEHVRNEELLSFHELTEEEQEILRREVKNGNVEWFGRSRCKWYQVDTTDLYFWAIYRTISQEEQEMQHKENNEFQWHMVSSEWNALARDDKFYSWYLYKDKPCKYSGYWYDESFTKFDEVTQKVIGVDMSKWKDIPWEDSLMLRPGYEQQDIVETVMDETVSDEEATVASSSSTIKEYPVVKLKNLHKLNIGDIIRLKKTGELIEVGKYGEIGCSGCKFSAYDTHQHPCLKCGFMEKAYVDYKQPTETLDETFANTEMKVYADLDDKTKQLLQAKQKEGKVQWLHGSLPPIEWIKKSDDLFFRNSVYRVV